MDLPRIPDAEYPQRWARLQAAMAAAGLDLLIAYADDHAVAGPAHARYLADFAPHFEPVCVLMPAAGKPLLLSGPETETYAQLTARIREVRVIREFTHPDEEYPYTTLSHLREVLAEAEARAGTPCRRAGVAGLDLMPARICRALEAALAGAEIVDAESLATGLRAIKSPAEQEVIRYAYSLARAGIEAAVAVARPGMREREVAAAAEHAMRSRGSEGMGIDTIVASGPNARPILARAGLRRIERDDLLLLTIAPRCEGYHAALGWPILFGNPGAEVRRALAAAAAAQRAGMEALHPGRPGGEVEGAARTVIESAGLGRHFLYSGVHSVGVVEFEPPIFGPSSLAPLEADMVLSIDVPIFHAPWGGLRIEHGYLITETGAEPLVPLPDGDPW
jgi:Xaa-Pro aminopeptidase